MSSFKNNIAFSIFGESHGKAIGINIEGLPAGIVLDMQTIKQDMIRRMPTKDNWSTKRSEADDVQIISGVMDNTTTGAPLCGIIYNTDVRSKDYSELRIKPRPGHADYPAHVKYAGNHDYRGGGHFSARLTAPLVFAGAIARQILKKHGIEVFAHIASIGSYKDQAFDAINPNPSSLQNKTFRVLDDESGNKMKQAISHALKNKDSIGGSVECAITGVPCGLGGPYFGGIEGKLASALYAIPAVKAVEFGQGKAFSMMNGSEANDAYTVNGSNVETKTNHCGGIIGGITNGMPIIVKATFKPTPSIAKQQKTVNLENMQETTLEIKGRHDACIVPRAVVVVEAMCALMILDEITILKGYYHEY